HRPPHAACAEHRVINRRKARACPFRRASPARFVSFQIPRQKGGCGETKGAVVRSAATDALIRTIRRRRCETNPRRLRPPGPKSRAGLSLSPALTLLGPAR